MHSLGDQNSKFTKPALQPLRNKERCGFQQKQTAGINHTSSSYLALLKAYVSNIPLLIVNTKKTHMEFHTSSKLYTSLQVVSLV